MVTRWRYFIGALMSTRCRHCYIVTVMITRRRHCPAAMERPLIKKTGWGTTERERYICTVREKEGMRIPCFMKKEDKSLIDLPSLSGVFIVVSYWRHPSQHSYDFRAQIEICVVAV